jgi:hypothetical protein
VSPVGGDASAVEAVAALERAAASDDAALAVDALELVGRAAVATPFVPLPLVTVTAFRGEARLVADAVRLLGTLAAEDGAPALPRLLHARSGYQALLDARAWRTPPLQGVHLQRTDAALVALVRAAGSEAPVRPRGAPATHTWWPRG